MGYDDQMDVAVLANDLADRQLMAELLGAVGCQASTFATPAELLTWQAGALPVVVVCHRQANEYPIPAVLMNLGCKRLLVFSDCEQENTVVETLEAGAHQFFSLRESRRVMQARLMAALRHHAIPAQRELVVDPFCFDLQKRRVLLHDEMLDLSPKEFDFAYYLFTNRGRIISNSELMTSVWSLPPGMDTRRIDTAACRVRKKMELAASSGWFLRRLRREGYELCRCERDGTNITRAVPDSIGVYSLARAPRAAQVDDSMNSRRSHYAGS
ncbi:MAG: response regulator transcription factor [Granulosicoccus sp.]